MTNAKRRTVWQSRIADYEASDLSLVEWCRENGVTIHQLRYWRRRMGNPAKSEVTADAGPGWACVELAEDNVAVQAIACREVRGSEGEPKASGKRKETATRDAGVSLRVGAATIEVRRGFDSTLLSEVLRVVVATC